MKENKKIEVKEEGQSRGGVQEDLMILMSSPMLTWSGTRNLILSRTGSCFSPLYLSMITFRTETQTLHQSPAPDDPTQTVQRAAISFRPCINPRMHVARCLPGQSFRLKPSQDDERKSCSRFSQKTVKVCDTSASELTTCAVDYSQLLPPLKFSSMFVKSTEL